MNTIQPSPGYVHIKVDKLAKPHEARRIAQQILDTIPDAERMPRAGAGWMRCAKCGEPMAGPHGCYRVK